MPSRSNLLDVDLQLVVFDNGQDYKLEWRRNGRDVDQIENFTIFWCLNRFPQPCGDRLQYKIVDRIKSSFILPKYKALYFAIAANSKFTSTGMHTYDCLSKPAEGDIN